MTQSILPQDDPRSVDELVEAALDEQDEELAWHAVCALHWRGTLEVLNRAETLCKSECEAERCLGAEILGQLGLPDRSFPEQSARLLFAMLDKEVDADVLHSIFVAFSHLREPRVIAIATEYVDHPDADVRHAVTLAIMGYEDARAVDLLIQLTTDLDSDVRDWATFGLGTLIEWDSPQLRDALVARLDDSDEDTRAEAIIGLARRQDPRVVSVIREELSDGATEKTVEAAELCESPELLPALKALRGSSSVSSSLLRAAIAACAKK